MAAAGAGTGVAGFAGSGGAAGADSSAALVCQPDLHPTSPLSLLTRVQYDATIGDLLGDTSQPSQSFPPENQVEGFNNNTEVHIANPLLVEQFMDAAEAIAGSRRGGEPFDSRALRRDEHRRADRVWREFRDCVREARVPPPAPG